MNPRIQELAKWAGYNGHYATEEFDVDEFARLIVLECIDLCELWNNVTPGSRLAEEIKKQFGVEQ